jgi:hypothetical protein
LRLGRGGSCGGGGLLFLFLLLLLQSQSQFFLLLVPAHSCRDCGEVINHTTTVALAARCRCALQSAAQQVQRSEHI